MSKHGNKQRLDENEWLRPAAAAPSFDSKRTSILKRYALAPSFGRKAALSQEEKTEANNFGRDEENFRNGLKRNIAFLSNMTRVNQEEMDRLREQLKAKDAEINSLKGELNVVMGKRLNHCHVCLRSMKIAQISHKGEGETKFEEADLQDTVRDRDLGLSSRHNSARPRKEKLTTYANMVVMASKLTSHTRDRLAKTASGPSDQDRMAEEMAVAAIGAKHTEQQLLRANRDVRGQLDRALKEAAALRADNISSRNKADLGEKEKATLQARVAWLSDEVKLQTAPLLALQLELRQAKSDSEVMRQRLQEERKENRIRVGEMEKASAEAQQRGERFKFDLNEVAKTCQREASRAAKLDEMFQEASAAASSLREEVEHRKADAKRMAQELSRIMLDSEKPTSMADPTPPPYASLRGDGGEAAGADGDQKETKQQLEEQRAEIATLKTALAHVRLEHAKSDDTVKGMRQMQQMHRAEIVKGKRASSEAQDRAAFFSNENNCLRLAMEKQEEEQRKRQDQQDQERRDRDAEVDKMASEQRVQQKSWRDRIRRILEDLCAAEEAGELMLTCLKCARLFKNPHVMAPCGHTLCADCCVTGDGGDGGLPDEESSGWVLGGGGGKPAKRLPPTCKICGEIENQGEDKVECIGMAPNRALATLVVKFAFRRKLLKTLKDLV